MLFSTCSDPFESMYLCDFALTKTQQWNKVNKRGLWSSE